MALPPVRQSWREVDANSWIIGDRLLLSRHSTRVPGYIWSDGDHAFFTISEASNQLRSSSQQHRLTSPFPIVYDAGDSHAVWKIGDAFLKVTIPISPHTTREHVTLQALREMELDFTIPEVMFFGEWDGRYYLILTKVPGQTLHEAWPLMSEKAKQDCVCRVTGACKLLATRESSLIGGINGDSLPEYYLAKSEANPDFSHEHLLKNCREVGMDCSTFVFYHCDLGPGNILIDLSDGSLGIIDWECAGFVPKEWVRTKFRVCGGMDLEVVQGNDCRHDWRAQMQRKLEEEGFSELALAWMDWYRRKD